MRASVLAALLLFPTLAAAQLRSEVVVAGLRNPVGVLADPADAGVLFVVEQNGFIRVARDGRLLPDPFLDLRDQISTGGERGLLGFAISPILESRRVFVNFTNRDGDTVVARFTRREDNPLRADPASRFDLVWPDRRRVILQPFSNHNGGHLAFGPDGYLYIGMGDGGSGGDPFHNAQDPNTLLGKMLRLDVNVDDDNARGYSVPDDNPFNDGLPVRALNEIWAFGLRNPWQFSFDPVTNALLVADVGQNDREEINFEPAGAGGRNDGWRIREGRRTYDTRRPPAYTPLTEPIHDYDHNVGASITGGFIYRGAALDPSFNGRYFYADFVEGRVFSIGLHLDDAGEATADDEREHTAALGGRGTLGMISAFGVDARRELLVVNWLAGTVLRIAPAPAETLTR
jgi:glucose/arabinose dehydrogenase